MGPSGFMHACRKLTFFQETRAGRRYEPIQAWLRKKGARCDGGGGTSVGT